MNGRIQSTIIGLPAIFATTCSMSAATITCTYDRQRRLVQASYSATEKVFYSYDAANNLDLEVSITGGMGVMSHYLPNGLTSKGEAWEQFRDRHGDWGRDAALWLARRHCGMTQAELGAAVDGLAYPAVGHAVRRIERRRQNDHDLNRVLTRLEAQLVENAT